MEPRHFAGWPDTLPVESQPQPPFPLLSVFSPRSFLAFELKCPVGGPWMNLQDGEKVSWLKAMGPCWAAGNKS